MLIPNIQLFAEGDADPTNTNGGDNGNGEPDNNTPTYTQEQLDKIVGERTDRATKSALSSFFKQKGLSEEEANKAIGDYLDQKAKNTPDVAQLQSDLTTANSDLLSERVKSKAQIEAIKQGVSVDSVPYVLKMAELKNVTNENGDIVPEKVTEAIKKVLDDVPALKGSEQNQNGNGIEVIGGEGGGGSNEPDATEKYRKALGLKPKK